MTILTLSLLALLQQATPTPLPASLPTGSAAVLAAAPASAWQAYSADALVVMELADGSRVVIALAPEFAPVHVANIQALAHAHWWDGTSINRVQDNYVVQWGDATEQKPLPPGIVAHPPAEYERPASGLSIRPFAYRDAYAAAVGHAGSWPIARDGETAWLTHCYGMVGVGRNMAPDTGTGAELYTVIGQAPRHLDRNIAMVGRVVQGMEALAGRRRGTGALGFYEDPKQRLAITSIRLASELPAADRPAIEVLRTDSAAFASWVTARANRRDDFFIRPADALDLCNALPPVRTIAKPAAR